MCPRPMYESSELQAATSVLERMRSKLACATQNRCFETQWCAAHESLVPVRLIHWNDHVDALVAVHSQSKHVVLDTVLR